MQAARRVWCAFVFDTRRSSTRCRPRADRRVEFIRAACRLDASCDALALRTASTAAG
ncbi:MAG: hypothetical protein MZW92_63910 [Comamonadaceae bacterium]|nr:hypothetical protein [Comamonadaceae bacterium]